MASAALRGMTVYSWTSKQFPLCLRFFATEVIHPSNSGAEKLTETSRDSSGRSLPHSVPDGGHTNTHVNPEYYNRNPRNMEMMNFALKRTGWTLEAERKDYYNKLFFERTPGHTRAYIMHASGRKVVSASTEEFAISRHLYRNTDVSAADNIGRILARRMLETGILHVFSSFTEEDRKSERTDVFLKSLAEGGIELTEMPRVTTPNPFGDMSARYLKSTSIRRFPPKIGPPKKKPFTLPKEID